MKTKYKFFNYLLSIGFTLFVFLFLVSLVLISRFVLSDANPISEHVIKTKNLLEDVGKVEKAAHDIEYNQTDVFINQDTFIKNQYTNANITDVSYANLNGKTIISMFINKKIENKSGIYYFKIKNLSELKKGDLLAYEEEKNISVGEFISYDTNTTTLLYVYSNKVQKINKESVLGEVFLDIIKK